MFLIYLYFFNTSYIIPYQHKEFNYMSIVFLLQNITLVKQAI